MIKLYQFARAWNIPNPSHFCTKLETYLRMAEIPYEIVETLPLLAPKGKLPFIEDDGKKIADSRFIIAYLKKAFGDRLDSHLSREERAISTALQRLIEEHFFWITMYTRWQYSAKNWREIKKAVFGSLSPVIRDGVAMTYRVLIRKQIYGHGTGRHNAEEICRLGKIDLDGLSDFLGNNPYFLGDKPTALDASAFGFLINTIGCPIESPVKEYALSKTNLADYCNRMKAGYFPELGS